MGNTATKEARPPLLSVSSRHSHGRGSTNASGASGSPGQQHHHSENLNPGVSPRPFRGSRPDLSFLGIGQGVDRDAPVERRETKQEREARRLERDRIARDKERERSMREEHVDGGYLVTQGIYPGPEDFNKAIVRQLMIERRLAPFWKGLEEFSESWTEHQLMAAARGLPIPAPDEIPPELEYKLCPRAIEGQDSPEKNLANLTVPITSRSQSYNSDTSSGSHPTSPAVPVQLQLPPSGSGSSSTHLFRGRAKTLVSLTASSRGSLPAEMAPREMQLPKDPFVNGQPIEAYLYKSPTECPICFLYYPPYLNRTRCCDQTMCSECFVQIKRADPHPPERRRRSQNVQPSQTAEPLFQIPHLHSTSAPPATQIPQIPQQDVQLVSQPAACPFCVQPDFGVTYSPPPFRRGLSYIPGHSLNNILTTPASSSSSVASGNANSPSVPTRHRATSLSANSPFVITTDKIRPDWAQKLQTARAQIARRSAAATALHTAAYLSRNTNDSRGTGSNRRRMFRRTTGHGSDNTTNQTGSVALLTERRASTTGRENESPANSIINVAPARASTRRSRMDELEEMMMMEAIRLSLASEEERRRKEEKEAKREARRREKEAKKAEKLARRTGLDSNNPSSTALDAAGNRADGAATNKPHPSSTAHDPSSYKGKGVDRPETQIEPPQIDSPSPGPSRQSVKSPGDDELGSIFGSPSNAAAKRSHLRYISSASSSDSSLVESTSGEQIGTSFVPNASSSALEPLLGFRSLDAVIGDEDKGSSSNDHLERVRPTEPVKFDDYATPSITNPALEQKPASTQENTSSISQGPSLSKDERDLADKELQANSVEIVPEGSNTMEAAS
ncbi:uncharacterized protein PADG_00419 [Paracoccidioides brasiliensis Pb18]|uniref:Protein SIP5 n=2 Tax=Paracoccidioides brasiliensis TaxID=121759 RepID=C1G0M9_PARBD|nr:uncharacterized protein PADG_00419 [Paracoccidioides brasiliensis Pb18]EEH44130.1 hypothetical protein PADG_00419 [Paracoccidioides brasiliensis Pb18]ODH33557.1 hypothetical protein ACO22_03305 [Paracoccidioides brasiliensis]